MTTNFTTLGQVAEVVAGQSPQSRFYNSAGCGLPFYQGKKDFGDRFISAPTVWTSKPTKLAQAGDILMSVRAPVGPINFATESACIGRGLAYIRPRASVNRNYLFYFLLSKQKQISGREGAVFASISKDEIASIPLMLRSLEEQERIVTILDEAFVVLAASQKNVSEQLSAISTLFEMQLSAYFQLGRKRWKQTCLGEVFDVRDGTHDSPKYRDSGFPLVTSKNLTKTGLNLRRVSFISAADYLAINKRSKVERGDILFAMIGTIGNPTLVEVDPAFAIKNVALIREFGRNSNAFVRYYLLSRLAKQYLKQGEKGTTQKFVGLGTLRSLPFFLPERSEQDKIVEHLNALGSKCEHLAGVLADKTSKLEILKQALLHATFTGRL